MNYDLIVTEFSLETSQLFEYHPSNSSVVLFKTVSLQVVNFQDTLKPEFSPQQS